MATKEGKEKDEKKRYAERVNRDATVANEDPPRTNPNFEKYLLPGPWTEEDEEAFQYVIREFGEGHGGRDSDL